MYSASRRPLDPYLKALEGAFNKEKALVRPHLGIVQLREGSLTALLQAGGARVSCEGGMVAATQLRTATAQTPVISGAPCSYMPLRNYNLQHPMFSQCQWELSTIYKLQTTLLEQV